jgi:Holliday junction resolvase RusA-like endonuclease
MYRIQPIHFSEKPIIKFIVKHDPTVQKNDLEIHKVKVNGNWIRTIGHSKRLKRSREFACLEMFKQYQKLGYTQPISYLIDVDFVFYVTEASEPDLDNLPPMYLDAMQGVKMARMGKVGTILVDDKLVRKIGQEKIVERDVKYYGKPRVEICIKPYWR